MTRKIEVILKEVLKRVELSKEESDKIDISLRDFLKKLQKEIKRKKLEAEVFVGGSYAKRTMIKKGKYDIDIFLRFGRKHEDISRVTKSLLKSFKNVKEIKGSRNYFQVTASPTLFFEIVPVRKVKKSKEARNITDLSFSHVHYVRRKVKSKKILDEIKIAKAFCYAINCYGAESYIHGFSGYGLELLIYHYKNFLKFIRETAKSGDEKIVIDIEKFYRNKRNVLLDINSSKLGSPIVLVDPTFRHRNVLAALSQETFEKFRKACRSFLKNPSIKKFEPQKVNLEAENEKAKKKKQDFILLTAKTDRQEGDIAGAKLFKFYNLLEKEISRFFRIRKKYFEYNETKSARYFFAVESRKEILVEGPFADDKKNSARFKKRHKKVFEKNKKIYAKEKVDFNLGKFIALWKKSNKKLMKEMSILGLAVV